MRERILGLFADRGVLLSPDAAERLLGEREPAEAARLVIRGLDEEGWDGVVVSLGDVERILG
ncbi:MAG: hypothetical protein J7L61_04250, partial [Thermoplasmata archaeon]|nr:hypothetical protein [Thermoplasmata archaeon]